MATFAYKSRCLSTQREAPQLSLFPRSTTGYSPPTAWLSRTALYLQNRKIIWIYLYLYTTGPFFCHQPYPLHATLNSKSKKKKYGTVSWLSPKDQPPWSNQFVVARSAATAPDDFLIFLSVVAEKKKFYFSRFFFSFLLVFDPLLRPTLFLSSNGLMTLSAPLSGHTPTISRQLL